MDMNERVKLTLRNKLGTKLHNSSIYDFYYHHRRVIYSITAILLIVALVLLPAITALAHSPLFPKGNHSPSTAYQINDPAKSWAIYTALEHEDSSDYYQFTLSKDEKIQVSLIVSTSPSKSEFVPSFAVLVPGLTQEDSLPTYVEVPDGYGIILVEGTDPGQATYEAFSPSWFYEVGKLTTNAPVDGTYYVVVFNHTYADVIHNHIHEAANYGIVIGYIEQFTLLELILVPYSVQEIYIWEGQSQFIVLLPIILVLIVGGIILYWRSRRGMAPRGVSKWLAAFAGLAFLGTAANTINQMLLAFIATGITGEAIITLVIVIISIILALFTFMYTVRGMPALTLWRRLVLIAIGVVALFTWSGLYLGPALVISAALVRSHEK